MRLAAAVSIDPGGAWSARLTIPKGMAPGRYEIDADREYFRSYTAFDASVPITVLAAG